MAEKNGWDIATASLGGSMNARKNHVRSLLVGVVVLAALFAFTGSALAADNSACLTCHDPGIASLPPMSMAVPDVDRDAACKACHIGGLVGTHPYHQPGSNCGSACHPGWGDSLMTAVPSYTDPISGASFASSTSKATSPAVLHIIHSDARWPQDIDTSFSACASCHAPAACVACHTGAVSANHTDHSDTGMTTPSVYPARAPWTGYVGHGVSGGNQAERTAGVETNQCATAGCHDIEGTKSNRPFSVEDYNYTAGLNPDDPTGSSSAITLTGTWRFKASSIYSGSRMSYNNVAGSQLTATFTGKRVELVSDKDPYRGKADVFLNGTKVATIDTYAPSTVYGAVVYSSDVATNSGPHTISVRPLNTRNIAARAAYVVVDSFRVYTDVPASIAPECLSCHADKGSGHGASFNHEATATAGLESGFTCTSCHSINMFTEHGRTTSSSDLSNCNACHPAYAPFVLVEYDYTCGGTLNTLDGAAQPCHNNATEIKHEFMTTGHNASAGANGADCKGCHGTDLALVHTEGSARPYDAALSAPGYAVSCLTCHGTAVFPTTKDCTSSLCHNASFGGQAVTMDNHVPVPHPGTNSGQIDVTRTGGFTCSTCHNLELTGEHTKASSLTSPGNAAIVCSNCHSAAYFPTDWMGTTNNTCTSCHPVAGGEAGMPHEAAEYTSKHNLSATAGNASCAGADCHNTATADTLHSASLPGAGACTSCHGTGGNKGNPPTVKVCATCHAIGHNMGLHTSTQTDCTACHSDKVSISAGHASCATCHSNTTLTNSGARYLSGTFTSACTSCHTAGVLPEPHAGSGGNYNPYDANHYVGTETTHTISGVQAATLYDGFACSACHKSEMKPEHFKATSVFANVPATYADKCVSCHEVKVDALVGAWDDTCTACHATNHTSRATKHDVTASSCTEASGCHDNDVSVIHKNSITTNLMTPSCASCHTNNTTVPTELSCGAAGCHAGMTAHGHTLSASAYDNTTVTGCTGAGAGCHGIAAPADYAVIHPANGCTSGTCHAAANHNDPVFNDPNSCQDCHGGRSSAPLLYDGAPDVVSLMDTGTAGHYNETTHTAAAMGSVVRGTTNGSASATCTNCHNGVSAGPDGYYTQHQGVRTGSLTCSDCHNKNAAIQTIVTDTTRTDTCIACHTGSVLGATEVQHATGNAPAVAGSSTAGCATPGIGCHVTADLHELHKNAAGCDITGCHDYTKQGIKPTLTTCGQATGCHLTPLYTTVLHNGVVAGRADGVDSAHHTAGATQMSATYTYNSKSAACSACHTGVLGTEHARTTSTLTAAGADNCVKCHNDSATIAAVVKANWANKNTTSACSDCHANTTAISAASAHLGVGNHATGTTSVGCTALGAGCHGTTATPDLTTVHTTGCALTRACHSPTVYNPTAKTCSNASCHPTANYNTTTYAHNAVNGTEATHTVTGASMATTLRYGTGSASSTCVTCHSSTLKVAHDITKATASLGTTWTADGECRGCHNATSPINVATLAAANTWTDTCTGNGCHTITQAAHVDGGTDPIAVTGTSTAGCATPGIGCHTTADLHELHKSAASCALTGCHDAANIDKSPTLKTCGQATGCHLNTLYTSTLHNGVPAGLANGNDTDHHTATGMTTAPTGTGLYTDASFVCSKCHVATLLNQHDGGAPSSISSAGGGTCLGCHNSAVVTASSTQVKASWTNNTCADCHTSGVHSTWSTTAHLGTPATGACGSGANNCHTDASGRLELGGVHQPKNYTGSCATAGCHDVADNNKSMVGAAKTCGGTGSTAACHDANGPGSMRTNVDGHTQPDHDILNIVPLATQAVGGSYLYNGITYAAGNSYGCGGCHNSDLVLEHSTVAAGGAGRTMDDGSPIGQNCGVCHLDMGGTVGAAASRSAIQGAITSNDFRCVTCHNGLATGTTAPHKGTATSTGSTVKSSGNPLAEFVDDGYKSGGHNIGNTNYAKTSPDNNGATADGAVTWLYRGTFTGTNPRTGTTWTATDKLLCSDCHRFSASAATGPQGAAAVYEVLATATTYTTARNYSTGAAPYNTTNGGVAPGMCGACHLALSATPHTNNANHNQPCVYCHSAIPHSSPRPRLLAGSADAAPYRRTTLTNGMDIKNTSTGATKTSCSNTTGGCSSHGATAPYW